MTVAFFSPTVHFSWKLHHPQQQTIPRNYLSLFLFWRGRGEEHHPHANLRATHTVFFGGENKGDGQHLGEPRNLNHKALAIGNCNFEVARFSNRNLNKNAASQSQSQPPIFPFPKAMRYKRGAYCDLRAPGAESTAMQIEVHRHAKWRCIVILCWRCTILAKIISKKKNPRLFFLVM